MPNAVKETTISPIKDELTRMINALKEHYSISIAEDARELTGLESLRKAPQETASWDLKGETGQSALLATSFVQTGALKCGWWQMRCTERIKIT